MKKIEANDSRQSVDLKWKKRKALESLINFDGNKAEIGGDMEVDGKASVNSAPVILGNDIAYALLKVKLPIEEITFSGLLPCIVFAPRAKLTSDIGFDCEINGAKALFGGASKIIVGENVLQAASSLSVLDIYTDDTFESKAFSMEDALNGWVKFSGLSESGDVVSHNSVTNLLVAADGTNILSLKELSLERGNLGSSMTLSGKTLSYYIEQLNQKTNAKYQHTVTLRTPTSATDLFCFTAMSSKSTPIDSYQDLTEVFGGCTVAGYGLDKTSKLAFTKLNLHGGTIATDSLTDGEESRTLASFQTVTFADDVCVPK